MIGRLRRDDAFDFPRAEVSATAREASGDAVAHKGRRSRAARRDPHPASDGRAPQQCNAMPRQAADRAKHLAPLYLRRDRAGMKLLFDGHEQLADTEQAHHRDDEVDALDQLVDTHRQAYAAGYRVDAD